MHKPLIALTASHDIKSNKLSMRLTYANAIRHCGGLPVILPSELSDEEAKHYAESLDGILFSGGPDLYPFLFGEETLAGCKDVSFLRDKTEMLLFSCFYEKKKPILGICRGIQLINVALGGTIYQDIVSQRSELPKIAHNQPFVYSQPAHTVSLQKHTYLEKITGTSSLKVNSVHHQAIKDVAKELIVSARSSDGLIEAVEKPDYPYLIGVQWHPEYLFDTSEDAKKLFHSFVSACHDTHLR